MGMGIEEELVWFPLTRKHSVGEINRFTDGKQMSTQKTIPFKKVDRSNEPKWANDGWCRRKAGRLGAVELGLERSSAVVPSRKAEGPVVVWVRSVGVT